MGFIRVLWSENRQDTNAHRSSLNLSVKWRWKMVNRLGAWTFTQVYFSLFQFASWVVNKMGQLFLLYFFFFKEELCKSFLYSLEPVLEKQQTKRTSKDKQQNEAMSEVKKKNSKEGVWGVKRAHLYSVCSECHGSDSVSIFITVCHVLWYKGQHFRPRTWQWEWELSWQQI